MASESKELSVRIINLSADNLRRINDEPYSNIFGEDELISLNNLSVFMEVPIMPLRCLCSHCDHTFDFSVETQNENYENQGMYRCFFSEDHFKRFRSRHGINTNDDA